MEKYDFLEEDGVRDTKNHEWRKEIQEEIIYILKELTNNGILEEDQFYILGE